MMRPLSAYLVWLLPPATAPRMTPVLHYVVEESSDRAAEIATQMYPGYRIMGMRDVINAAA
jgi:hypothetical protein